jgi:hypothetical protein
MLARKESIDLVDDDMPLFELIRKNHEGPIERKSGDFLSGYADSVQSQMVAM